MALFKKQQILTQQEFRQAKIHDFLDLTLASKLSFKLDYLVSDSQLRCVWAVRMYPIKTEDLAILRKLGEMDGVTLKINMIQCTDAEQQVIINTAVNNANMKYFSTNKATEKAAAKSDREEILDLINSIREKKIPLVHCRVFIEMHADTIDELDALKSKVKSELSYRKISIDRLYLQQKDGFLSVFPGGVNQFGDKFDRVLPADSISDLFPFSYSGKVDPKGFSLGRDRFGSGIFVDFDRRAVDITNANIAVLGNSGEGKSYLGKGIITNLAMANKNLIILDPEHEYEELVRNLGGTYLDLMEGDYKINILECRTWNIDDEEDDGPAAFHEKTAVSQHVSFLRDFFRSYKITDNTQLDILGILIEELYGKYGITDKTDLSKLSVGDYPILSDLYNLAYDHLENYQSLKNPLYSYQDLQIFVRSIHSICTGAESRFFNGQTNILTDRIIGFGMKELLAADQNLRSAMLFNVLSYMSNMLLQKGNGVAVIDEFYLFIKDRVAVEYVRNCMKRVRKKDSSVMIMTQNLEDFNLPGVSEYTKPLLSIPSHLFLFYPGKVGADVYKDNLQISDSEYNLISKPSRGSCLYLCGNERYALQVHFSKHKTDLFGFSGGR